MSPHFNLVKNISIVLIGLLILVLVGIGLVFGDEDSILIALGFGSFMVFWQILSIAGGSRLDRPMQSTCLVAGPISFGFVMGSLLFFNGLVLAELFENHLPPEIFMVLGTGGGLLTWIVFAVISYRNGPNKLRGEFMKMSLLWTVLPALFSIPWGLIAMNHMEKRSGWFSGITGGFLVIWSCLALFWALVPLLFILMARYREKSEDEASLEAQTQSEMQAGSLSQALPIRENRKEAPFED